MSLNLVQICEVKYPGQIEAMAITFRQIDATTILFDEWNVPAIARPTEAEVLAEEPLWATPYALFVAQKEYTAYIVALLDSTAQAKQFDNAISCVSYSSSTNLNWKAQADAFISWRDAVFAYAINIQTEVQAGTIPLPTLAEFIAGLPVITWP